jgi:EAL domain-containing protein (putative c-di-GMP-specific phosphodiesterase class I)
MAELLNRYDVAPERLGLEITESMLALDPERALEILRELDTMGVRLSIDDFGTGYSSLTYLTRLPVDEVKIDRSFVADMTVNVRNALSVRSVIDLGLNLGLQVVAEGVEDAETCRTLAEMGCGVLQGYFIGRPLPAAQAMDWLPRKSA